MVDVNANADKGNISNECSLTCVLFSTAKQQPGHGQRATHPLPQWWTIAILLWYQVKCTETLRMYHTESAVMCHVVELCRSCVCGWISCMGHPRRPTHRCCFTALLPWFSRIIKTAYYTQRNTCTVFYSPWLFSVVFTIPLSLSCISHFLMHQLSPPLLQRGVAEALSAVWGHLPSQLWPVEVRGACGEPLEGVSHVQWAVPARLRSAALREACAHPFR